ncbi:hypothetical protein ACVINW_006067 [Bradyrhizobium sp. USDA 4461]
MVNGVLTANRASYPEPAYGKLRCGLVEKTMPIEGFP